jgi:uncharacterized protein (TIGR02246 family)
MDGSPSTPHCQAHRPGDRDSDEAAIRAVLHRAAIALDALDWDMLASCYGEHATAVFQGTELTGREQIIHYVRQRMPTFVKTMHAISTTTIDLQEETARTECYAIAYMVEATTDGNRLLMRGVRYLDDFARVGRGWCIAHRVHRPEWMSVLPVSAPGILGS